MDSFVRLDISKRYRPHELLPFMPRVGGEAWFWDENHDEFVFLNIQMVSDPVHILSVSHNRDGYTIVEYSDNLRLRLYAAPGVLNLEDRKPVFYAHAC